MKAKRDKFVGIEILVVDADKEVQEGMASLFAKHGFVVSQTDNADHAIELIRKKFFAVVLCDLDLRDTDGGLVIVDEVKKSSPATFTIVLSPRKAYGAAITSFRHGAGDIVVKEPDAVDYLQAKILEKAKEWKRAHDRDELLLQMAEVHEDFLVRMREMYRSVVDMQDRLQGRNIMSSFKLPECRVLVVDDAAQVYESLTAAFATRDDGWIFHKVHSGGEALDLGGQERFHIALVKDMLPDLPGTMVLSSLRGQSPETLYVQYGTVGKKGAQVIAWEGDNEVALIPSFTDPMQLAGKLDGLRDAFGAKAIERRYIQSFRTTHYDFLKKYAEVQKELRSARQEIRNKKAS